MFLLLDLITTEWASRHFVRSTSHYMEQDKHLKTFLPLRSQCKDFSILYFSPKVKTFCYMGEQRLENSLTYLRKWKVTPIQSYCSTSDVPHRDIGNFPSYFSYLTPACFSQKIIATPYKFSWHRLVSQHRLVSHGIDWYHILVWQLHVQS